MNIKDLDDVYTINKSLSQTDRDQEVAKMISNLKSYRIDDDYF